MDEDDDVRKLTHVKPEEFDEDYNGESDEEDLPDYIKSIRTKTGLETGIQVDWPSMKNPLMLSTCMEAEDISPMFGGTAWAGTRIWRAAVAATDYVIEFHGKDATISNALELGAGLGLPGMILHGLFGWNVVLSDLEPLPRQMQLNIEKNFPETSGKRIHARELDWSREGVQDLLKDTSIAGSSLATEGFDIVLNCDCVYEPLYGLSWKCLVEATDELLRVNPQTIMITSLERRKADGIDNFLVALEQSPNIQKVERLLEFDSKYPEVQLYRIYGSIP